MALRGRQGRSIPPWSRGQRAEVRDQRSEGRGQRSEIRGQRSEIRGQRSEGRPDATLNGKRQKVPITIGQKLLLSMPAVSLSHGPVFIGPVVTLLHPLFQNLLETVKSFLMLGRAGQAVQ